MFDDIVAKLKDVLACHEQARPGSMAEMPCHSEEAHLDSHLNVSTPPWRGATNTYAMCEGNVYNQMPSKGKLALDEVGPAQNHLGAGHPVHSKGDSLADPIQLMIAEAKRVQEGLGPNLDIFTCAGVKIPHPKLDLGEVDLKWFKVFIAGILQWLLLNLLLGSGVNSTLVQLKYLGTRLAGDASE